MSANILQRPPALGQVTVNDLKPAPTAMALAGLSPEDERIVERWRLPDGGFDVAGMMEEERRLAKKVAPLLRKQAEHHAMMKTLERFLAILKDYNLGEHDRPLPMLFLRSKLRQEYFVHMDKMDAEEPAPIKRFVGAHWFDFRSLPTARANEMIEFGRELLEAKLVRLPFDVCVFVFPYVCPDGSKVTSACLLRQDPDNIVAEGVIHIEAQGRPLGFYGRDEPPNGPIFYALAVLSSKSVVQRKRATASGQEVDGEYRGDSYLEVALRPRYVSVDDGGTHHASPRLHWRRGHIRHLGNRTTWVRATLVGASDNGVVVHDYSVTRVGAST